MPFLKDLSFLALSWNVNSQPPLPEDALRQLFTSEHHHGVVCVCLQEVHAGKLAVSERWDPSNHEAWKKVLGHILEAEGYDVKVAHHWGGLVTVLALRKDLAEAASELDIQQLSLGIWRARNKGSVGVSLRLLDVQFLLVNSHFAGHNKPEDRARRLENWRSTMQMTFEKESLRPVGRLPAVEHDIVVHCGDMNWRLQQCAPEDVTQVVRMGEWKRLHNKDELLTNLMSVRDFAGWQTALPFFRPTFKLLKPPLPQPQENIVYDLTRVPSYTDRLLWRLKPKESGFKVISGDLRTHECTLSDHLPIVGSVVLGIRSSVERAQEEAALRARAERQKAAIERLRLRLHGDLMRVLNARLQQAVQPSADDFRQILIDSFEDLKASWTTADQGPLIRTSRPPFSACL